jgi:hypothetical protein
MLEGFIHPRLIHWRVEPDDEQAAIGGVLWWLQKWQRSCRVCT